METKTETVTETTGTHNHDCDPSKCKAKKEKNQIKRKAQYSTPTVAIANEISEISDDYAVLLAMPNSVGWHYGQRAYFISSTPNIWLLLRNLQKIQNCRILNVFKKLPVYCAPSDPVPLRALKLKFRCKIFELFRVRKCCAISSSNSENYFSNSEIIKIQFFWVFFAGSQI